MHDWLKYLILLELERTYYVKYGGDPFYLVIDDLKGYFKYSKEKDTAELMEKPSALARSSLECRKELEFITEDQRKRKTHNQIWNKIKELINNIHGVNFKLSDYSRDGNVIRFNTDDTFPLYYFYNDCY